MICDILLSFIALLLLMILGRMDDRPRLRGGHQPRARVDVNVTPPTGSGSGLKPPNFSAARRPGRQPLA